MHVSAASAEVRPHIVLYALCAILTAYALSLVHPADALAGWPLAAPSQVMLGFGETYSSSGESARHRGADIEAAAGEPVLAPLPGRVAFAGRVPGVGGGTVLAIALETARGRLTLLPLERIEVSAGDELTQGETVGPLAGTGDGSSATTHLHVGAKTGDLYVDPLGIMVPPAVPADALGGSIAQADLAAAPAPEPQAGVQVLRSVEDPRVALSDAPGVEANPGVSANRTSKASDAARKTAREGSVQSMAAEASPGELAPGVSVAPNTAPTLAGDAIGLSGSLSIEPPGCGSDADASGVGSASSRAVESATGIARTAQTAATRASSQLDALLPRASGLVRRVVRAGMMGLLGVLGGVGMLWPLWRPASRKGSGKVRVRSLDDDVAAALGR